MRKWSEVPLAERNNLLKLMEDNGFEAIKKQHPTLNINMTPESLRRKLNDHREYRNMILAETAASIQMPVSQSRKWTDQIVVDGDDWIIAGDIEIPDHNADMLRLILLVAMKLNIKNLIINGDLIATDQQALNAWVSTWRVGGGTYEDDVNETNAILEEFRKWFGRIIITEGNHDDRIARKTGGEIYLGMLIPDNLAEYSRYSYMYIRTTNRGLIKVVHPETFSKLPIGMAQSFYASEVGPNYDPLNPFKTMEKAHFVVSHTHIDAFGWSPDGVYEMHAIGTCRDPKRTAYKNKGQNRHFQWNPSFLAIKNGHFQHFHLSGTDWQAVLGDLYAYTPHAERKAG